jgi:hypothetical protein
MSRCSFGQALVGRLQVSSTIPLPGACAIRRNAAQEDPLRKIPAVHHGMCGRARRMMRFCGVAGGTGHRGGGYGGRKAKGRNPQRERASSRPFFAACCIFLMTRFFGCLSDHFRSGDVAPCKIAPSP